MRVTKAALKAITDASSKDVTRFNINHVFFQPDCIEATDGHRLYRAKATFEDRDRPYYAITRDDCLRIIKMVAKGDDEIEFFNPQGSMKVVVQTADGTNTRTEVDIQHVDQPDFEKVMPNGKAEGSAVFSAQYLKHVADTALKNGHKAVRLELFGKQSPALFSVTDELKLVVMPMRW